MSSISITTRPKRTNARWVIAFFMWAAIAINYLDRSNLSAAAPIISKQFHISAGMMGIILSAFSWSYTVFQIPSGWFADRIGHRVSLAFAVAWWSIMTAAMAVARGATSLIWVRVLLGLGEAGAYPSNAGVTAKWFPDKERTRASAIFDSGSKVGTAIAMPLIVILISSFGWQTPFVISGGIGILWAILWIWYYRDPERHKYANEAEIKYIREGQKKHDGIQSGAPMPWYALFRYRNILAMAVGFFTLNYAIYFFITWFPSYLVEARGMKMMTMGFVAMLPPLCGLVAELFAGYMADKLYARGMSLTAVRKWNLVGGMFVATSIAFAGLVQSAAWSIVLLSISYAGLEFAASAIWSLPGDVAPENMTSIVGGIQNCVSNIAGILGPIVTGVIVATMHSFIPALILSGVITLIGAATYLFWLGKVEPIKPKVSKNSGADNFAL